MVYKPLAVRVALVAGFRRALPVFRYMIVVAAAVVMWESPQGFPRGVGRVESRLLGFPCFPYSGISMACFCSLAKSRFSASPKFRSSEKKAIATRLMSPNFCIRGLVYASFRCSIELTGAIADEIALC